MARQQTMDPAGSDAAAVGTAPSGLSGERLERIRQAAYRRAEGRGFVPGYELDDWLAAERDVDTDAQFGG